jgi:hypothetical protein
VAEELNVTVGFVGAHAATGDAAVAGWDGALIITVDDVCFLLFYVCCFSKRSKLVSRILVFPLSLREADKPRVFRWFSIYGKQHRNLGKSVCGDP